MARMEAESSKTAENIAIAARRAFEASQLLDSAERDVALAAMRLRLEQARSDVLAANQRDMDVSRSAMRGAES